MHKEYSPLVYVIVVTFCISFLANSVMVGWEKTRRSAEELRIIKTLQLEDISTKAQSCIDGGGMPDYSSAGGKALFTGCKKNN